MSIKSFSPCSDWFFVFEDNTGKTINYRLAGWAVMEDQDGKDKVVGLVPVMDGGNSGPMSDVSQLVVVPPVHGTYKHKDEIAGKKGS